MTDFVSLHAQGRPDSVALVDAGSGQRWTYDELHRAVAAAVGVIAARGIEAGDRIAAISRNSPELVILQLACARSGAILAPLNWRLSDGELRVLIADCEPSLLFGDALLDRLDVDIPKLSTGRFREELAAASPVCDRPVDPDGPSLMLYTSGTSGRSKGVPLTEANLLATAVNFSVVGEVTADSAFLVDSPMFHIIGMVTNIRPALMMGGRIVVSDGFDPARTLQRLGDPELGITHYFCVPQMADMLRQVPGFDAARLHGLTALFTGGAPHPAPKIHAWLADGVTVVDGYGMTEAGTVLGMPVSPGRIEQKAGSAGLMPPTMERRIVDPNGADCGPDEVGELALRGPNIFSGYWRRPDDTAAAFTDDGFFLTGDLVRQDDDGFYFLVDRKKDMFISGGENVYPAEIEVALKSHPDVIEAAVVGTPDDRWGEVGHAFVKLRAAASVDGETLVRYCEQHLARYKLPRRVHILAELPTTGSGKVIKSELKKRLREQDGHDA